jgi:hypothetical protein
LLSEIRRFAWLMSSRKKVQVNEEVLMSRRPIPLAAVEPDVFVPRWKIFEPVDGFKHLVGSDALCTGCVVSYLSVHACTSPVIIFGLSDVIY